MTTTTSPGIAPPPAAPAPNPDPQRGRRTTDRHQRPAEPDQDGRWYSSTAGFVSIGAALVVLAGVIAAIFGFGHADHTVEFLRGNAWLSSDSTGSVVRVNGGTGKPDFEMKFKGASGEDLEVVQGPDGVFVLNRETGEVTKLDEAQLQLGGSVKMDPADQPLFVIGGGKAYLVARRTGRVQQVDPQSADLASVGAPVDLGHAVANAIVDDRGWLVAAIPDTGELAFAVDGRRDAPVRVADPGDKLTISLVSDLLVAIDHTKGTVAPVDPSKGVLTVFTIQGGAGDGELNVVDKMSGNRLWVVSTARAELLGIDVRSGDQLHVPIPDTTGDDLGAPLANGNFVYVPDYARGQLVKVDIAQSKVVDRVAVNDTKGKFESFVKDDRVWGNDPVGELAVVIDRDGNAQKVEKYRPGLPTNEDGFGLPPASTPTTAPKSTTPPVTPPKNPTDGPTTTTTRPDDGGAAGPDPTGSTTTTTTPAVGGGPLRPTIPPVVVGPGGDPTKTSSTTTPSNPPTGGPGTPNPQTGGNPPLIPPVAGVPGGVAPVTATATDGGATVNWMAAADNGSPVSRYELVAQAIDTPPMMVTQDAPAGQTSASITGLSNGRTYTVSVRAVNAIGNGPASVSNPFTPAAATPSTPGPPQNVVGSLVVDGSTNDRTLINLHWEAPSVHPELVTDYEYACWEQTGSVTPTFQTIPANTSTYDRQIGSLNYQTVDGYTCSVHALVNGTQVSSFDIPNADTLWPFRAADAPTNLGNGVILPGGAKQGDPMDVDLSWTNGYGGGRPIGSSEVEIEEGDGSIYSHYVSLIAPNADQTIHFQGRMGYYYRFRVRHRNVVDGGSGIQFQGAWSSYLTLMSPMPTTTVPSTPPTT